MSVYSEESCNWPHGVTQEDLNGLASDLYLCKQQSELLVFWLKQNGRRMEGSLISGHWTRTLLHSSIWKTGSAPAQTTGLFTFPTFPHNTSAWCLFIDFSKRTLKDVFLLNGNEGASISIDYSVHLKKSYDNMELFVTTAKYQWSLCGDFKVIELIMRMQAVYCCFLSSPRQSGCIEVLRAKGLSI